MSRNQDLNRFFGARPVLFVQPLAQATSIALEDDELALDLDEPPEHKLNDQSTDCVPSFNMSADTTAEDKEYTKQPPTPLSRQCSLLTRSLLSASTPNETSFPPSDVMARANSQASAYSLSSNHGLTSDGGLSSPAHSGTPSPPMPAAARLSTVTTSTAPASNSRSIKFAGETVTPKSSNSPREPSVVRKKCISFAGAAPKPKSNGKEIEAKAEQPKKACSIRFACHPNPVVTAPTPIQPHRKQTVQSKTEEKTDSSQQVSTPLPTTRRHRNSQSVHGSTSDSFKARLSSSSNRASPSQAHKLEKERLKRLASNRPEDEAWVNENPKARKPITVTDTLRKENAIRQLAAEAEEEALEESMDALIDDEDDEDEEDATGSKYMAYDEDDSDGGHETDDEGGFAESDDDSDDDPDFQFWTTTVANAATATGSVQQRPLEMIRPRRERTVSESSFDSIFRSGPPLLPPRTGTKHNSGSRRGSPKAIKMRPGTPELPDSTDFVCGTLDEDKPLEDAYLSCLKQRKRERQGIIPQDLDPSFPTSDPENNEDEEEDEVTEGIASTASDHHFLGGRFDESDNSQRRGRASSPRPMAQMPMVSPQNAALPAKKPQRKKSPAPPPVHRKILRSPAPAAVKTSLRNRSPMPAVSQKIRAKSPAPQALHFARAKSPLPGRLFGQSPVRPSFPPPAAILRSPPASPKNIKIHSAALAERPGHIKTASLPHTPNPFFITHERRLRAAKKKSNNDGHDRGPIDIKQGLEDRKQRRKEHYWRKHCRDHKDKSRRCAPGKGAERMRVLGLEMAHRNKAYGQKLELMLSV